MLLDVVVPKEHSPLRAVIDRGAGCVLARRDTMCLLYHQGDGGAFNITDYAGRVEVAAFRARDGAPTHAKVAAATEDVHIIGAFNTDTRTLTIDERGVLAEWLDAPSLRGPERLEVVFGEPPHTPH